MKLKKMRFSGTFSCLRNSLCGNNLKSLYHMCDMHILHVKSSMKFKANDPCPWIELAAFMPDSQFISRMGVTRMLTPRWYQKLILFSSLSHLCSSSFICVLCPSWTRVFSSSSHTHILKVPRVYTVTLWFLSSLSPLLFTFLYYMTHAHCNLILIQPIIAIIWLES